MQLPFSVFISPDQTSQRRHQGLIAWILSTFYGDCIWRMLMGSFYPYTSSRQSRKDHFSALCMCLWTLMERYKTKDTKSNTGLQILSTWLCLKMLIKMTGNQNFIWNTDGTCPGTRCLRELWPLYKKTGCMRILLLERYRAWESGYSVDCESQVIWVCISSKNTQTLTVI